MTFRAAGERVAYAGPFLTVVQGTFETEGGDRIEREFLRHPGAVAVVALDGDDVVLVRQFRAAVGRDLLEIPAGLLDKDGEGREDAARRELEEEAGLRVTGPLVPLVEYFPSAGMADHRVWIYLATETEACAVSPQGLEEQHMTIERVPLADVDRLVATGEVLDGKTIVGLLLARDHRR